MRKIIATTIVVFILFGTATATLDDDLLRAVGNAVISEATIGK